MESDTLTVEHIGKALELCKQEVNNRLDKNNVYLGNGNFICDGNIMNVPLDYLSSLMKCLLVYFI